VRADLRGVDTHGLTRLPGYLDRVRRGLINPKPKLFPNGSAHGGGARWPERLRIRDRHARHGRGDITGPEIGDRDRLCKKEYSLRMAASYVLQALDADSSRWSSPTPRARCRPGRREALRDEPLAAGARAESSRLSCSTCPPPSPRAARSGIAEKRGEKIPLGYALDAQGRRRPIRRKP